MKRTAFVITAFMLIFVMNGCANIGVKNSPVPSHKANTAPTHTVAPSTGTHNGTYNGTTPNSNVTPHNSVAPSNNTAPNNSVVPNSSATPKSSANTTIQNR